MSTIAIALVGADSFVFSLYHDLYCEKRGACDCKISKILRPVASANGAVGQQYEKVVTPRSVYLNRGEPVRLHRAALNIPQLVEARRLGLIEVKVIETENGATQEPTIVGSANGLSTP